MTDIVNEKVIHVAKSVVKNFAPDQAVKFLRGMASVNNHGATSRRLREMIADIEASTPLTTDE